MRGLGEDTEIRDTLSDKRTTFLAVTKVTGPLGISPLCEAYAISVSPSLGSC